ncbi:ComF family protein [Candidatus Omnitrophota bacterium]
MLKTHLRAALDILYPKNCLLCKHPLPEDSRTDLLCCACWPESGKNVPPFCLRCGGHLKRHEIQNEVCSSCCKKQFAFNRSWSAFRYDGTIKELIHLFKYKNKTALRFIFGKLLADFINEYHIPMSSFDIVIPVPLHPTRLREREYNQTDMLARELTRYFPLRLSTGNLMRIRQTQPQSSLEAKRKWDNVRGAFKLKNPKIFKDNSILIIDDLFTTGATVSEIADVLATSGAEKSSVLTLAIAQ